MQRVKTAFFKMAITQISDNVSEICRPPDKHAHMKIIFLMSQQKRTLWVLKRFFSMIRFFSTQNICFK